LNNSVLDLATCLYRDLSVTYPVLAVVGAVGAIGMAAFFLL